MQFCQNTDSLEQQTKLTADVGAARLKAGSTWSEVDMFVQLLHDKWSRIAINQTALSLHGFWRQLLVAMRCRCRFSTFLDP